MNYQRQTLIVLTISLFALALTACRRPAATPTPDVNYVTVTPGGSTADPTPTANRPDPTQAPTATVEPVKAKINGPTRTEVGREVTFNSDGSSGPIAAARWDFGDNTTASDQTTVSHTYQTPGTFEVSLTVQGEAIGSGSDTATLTVTIEP